MLSLKEVEAIHILRKLQSSAIELENSGQKVALLRIILRIIQHLIMVCTVSGYLNHLIPRRIFSLSGDRIRALL